MKEYEESPAACRLERKQMNAAIWAWIVVGGLAVLGGLVLFIHELPAIRREMHLLRM